MRFYNNSHPHYCGIDLHARMLYVCIIDDQNDKVDSYIIAKLLRGDNFPMAYEYPQEIRVTRDLLRRRSRLVRYSGELKAHVKNTASQYNLPDLNRLNLRYENNREQVRELFPDDMVQASIDLDLDLVNFFDKELGKIEWKLKKHAQKFNSKEFNLLKTFPGVENRERFR